MPPLSASRRVERVCRACLVEPHRLAALSLPRSRVEVFRRADVGEFFERVAHLVAELGRLDIERWPPVARDQRESKRQRRVRYVRAADVESPGDILRIGHQQRVGAEFLQFGANALELVGCALAGEFEFAQS